jgi:hypothetical protein
MSKKYPGQGPTYCSPAHFARLIGVTPRTLKKMMSLAYLHADARDVHGNLLFALSDAAIKEAKREVHKYRSRSPEL